MSIFRYLISHQRSDYGHNDYRAHNPRNQMEAPVLPEADKWR